MQNDLFIYELFSRLGVASVVCTPGGRFSHGVCLQGVLVGGWLQKQEELEKRINELTEENMQLALAKDEMEQQMHQLSVQVGCPS